LYLADSALHGLVTVSSDPAGGKWASRLPVEGVGPGDFFPRGLYTSAQNLERNYKNWKELMKFRAEGGILSHIAIHGWRFQRHN
jgi:hypothetical protein